MTSKNIVEEFQKLCDALSESVDVKCLDDWFNTPNQAFEDRKPLELFLNGEKDRLWAMVYQLNSGEPLS